MQCVTDNLINKLNMLIDIKGNKLKVDDIVKIIGIPNLTGMSKECKNETLSIFEYVFGKTKKITAIDEHNELIELSFRILKGKSKGFHSIYIEPFLLEKIN